jgi:hypothetical protein
VTELSTVRNLSSHVEDVAPDGRVIEPGGFCEKVDVSHPHNKAKIEDGVLTPVDTKSSAKEKEDK